MIGTLPDGTSLGRYQIVRLLNQGGMGEVYLAEDRGLNRYVAIKIVIPHQDSNKLKNAQRHFDREMKAIAQFNHPYILPLFDVGESSINETKYSYLVMPYCEEGTLATWLKPRRDKRGPFPSLQDVAHMLSQASDALQQAHDAPELILHLDVKPANFLIRTNKEHPNYPDLLLADFGIATFINATTPPSTSRSKGTAYYMPPEQWKGIYQPASDQYALAVMAYELLTFEHPFEDGDNLQLMYQHLHTPPKSPSTLNPLIPPEIDAVIIKALAKNYEDRYPTVTAFANAFKQALIDIINNASTRVILSISKTEAETGGSYPLKLSDGREIPVAVRPGVQDGQEIRQEGLGVPPYEGGPSPALIITINVRPESESERKITNQLQSLEQAFKSNQSTNQILLERVEQIAQTYVPSPIVPNPSPPPHPKPTPPDKPDKILKLAFVILFIMLILSLIFTVAAGIYQNQQNTDAIATAIARSAATVTAVTRNVTATTTATYPYPSYLPGHGTIALFDSLDGTNNYYHWDTTSGCNFTGGVYHVIDPSTSPPYFQLCATSATFNNFAVEVTMIINSGNCGGIAFGKNSSTTEYYQFQICSDGNFIISQYNKSDVNINSGLHQTNTLTVLANGNQIAFYVNHHQIQTGPLSDYNDTYSQGQIGVLAVNYNQLIADVSYTNLKVWTF